MKYRVHSAHVTDVETVAAIGGKDVTVKAPGIIVEMVPLEAHGKSFTHVALVHSDMDRAAATDFFKPGRVVSMGDFEGVDE